MKMFFYKQIIYKFKIKKQEITFLEYFIEYFYILGIIFIIKINNLQKETWKDLWSNMERFGVKCCETWKDLG